MVTQIIALSPIWCLDNHLFSNIKVVNNMGLVKNGFIDLGNGFFINADLVQNIDKNGGVLLKNGEFYAKGELTKPSFLMNNRYCYDLYDTNRKVDKMSGDEYE